MVNTRLETTSPKMVGKMIENAIHLYEPVCMRTITVVARQGGYSAKNKIMDTASSAVPPLLWFSLSMRLSSVTFSSSSC